LEKKPHIIFSLVKYSIFFFGVFWIMYSLTIDLKQDREEYEQQSNLRNSTPIMDGALLYEKGEIDKAAKLFEQLLKLDPNDYKTRMILAEIFHEQCIRKDTLCEHALLQLTLLIRKFPKKLRPLELRSKLFLKLNDTISSRNDVITISKIKQPFSDQ
jgi:tetratricopeptide (TPR) repeat protein